MRSSRTISRLIITALVALAWCTAASAQPLIYAVVPDGSGVSGRMNLFEVPVEEGGQFGTPVPVAGIAGSLVEGPEVTAGGQLVIWTVRPPFAAANVPGRVVAFDRATRTLATAGTVTRLGASDPSRLRFFPTIGTLVHRLTPAGATPLPGTEGLTVVKVSADGQRLYAFRGELSTERSIEVRDSATGALLRSIPLPADATLPTVTEDESSLYVVAGPQNAGSLRRLDAATGAELASIALPSPSPLIAPSVVGIVTDDARQRLAVSLSYFGPPLPATGELWTLDATTLQQVERVSTGGTSQLRLDARVGQLFMISSLFHSRPVPQCESTLQTASVTTGQIGTSIPTGASACLRFALAVPPPAPVLAEPVVSGSSVNLTWTIAGLTTGLVVEAGSGPGLADIATLSVPGGTTLSVPNVPPGDYFVRVRALNYVGSSEASNEVRVSVP